MGKPKASESAKVKFKPYIKLALDNKITDAVVIETSQVYTAPWVRMKCQFGCAGYGETLCCPPHTPTSEEMRTILDSYTHGILLHLHWKKSYTTVNRFNDIIVDMERTIFLDGCYKAWSLGSGPCDRCENCNISGTCFHADRARPSMEGCGIDVFKTAREQGLPINVVRNHSDERNIYGLILIE
jgi:predicted metal-binding protein